MKKLFLLAIMAFAITSCSSDDSSSTNPTSSILIKKEIDHNPNGSTVTSNFSYNGNKLLSVTDTEGGITNYTYTGDLITNIKYYTGTVLEQEDIFTYNGDQLSSHKQLFYDVSWGDLDNYVYNSDGTITVNSYSGDLDVTATGTPAIATITFLNGEVSQIVSENSPSHTYTYDMKNNPFKNVTGYKETSFAGLEAFGVLHNVLTDNIDGSSMVTNVYTYNSADYPTTSVETYSGEETTTEYFYE